ncbi:MAG: N-acetylmuramoyl-L-alanine amidase [Bacteroidota bacterium]
MIQRFLFLLLPVLTTLAQPADSLRPFTGPLFLRVVIPETDTITAPVNRHRIAASTIPGARAFVGDKEAKVYQSGGFAGLVELQQDTVVTDVKVIGPAGDSVSRRFIFLRSKPLLTSPHDTLAIDSALMEPAVDRWIGPGDILEVRFKGSPGYEASFSLEGIQSDIPMRELSGREAGGLEGVYVGRYVVNEGDEALDIRVGFELRRSFWSSEEAVSKGRVRILAAGTPSVGELRGRRPFLNAGLGDDRLGGAKLGYLDAGVRLAISGKARGQYKIRLTPSMVAWVPEENMKLLPEGTPVPASFVGSITASGNSTEDIIIVGLSDRLPFITEQQLNPAAVIVNIFGATSNTNWITHHLSAEGIQNISWEQAGEGHYRLKIALTNQAHWGYDVSYRGGANLHIRIRRPPAVTGRDSVLRNLTIAVDAGHGGENFGAIGSTGARERDITLEMASQLELLLKSRGARVIMTRTDTNGVSNFDRIERTLSSKAHLLVSIHCNSVGLNVDAERVQGTSTFFHHAGFKPLADQIYARMLELGLAQFGVVGGFNFALNGLTQLPSVLVETAFISNPDDEMKLLEKPFREQIAAKIVLGLEEFLRNQLTSPTSPAK